MTDVEPPIRFPLAFRVGVSGTLHPDPEAVADLRRAIAAVLSSVAEQCRTLAAEPWAARAHALEDGRPVLNLKVLSPLAEGADRLVAEEALALADHPTQPHRYELFVPIPFDQAEYETDFPKTVDRFAALLARAEGRMLTLDGATGGKDRWRSYEAVGQFVVRNCDLLIAIWDDEATPKGRGGTEDMVRFALRAGLPIWWIHASGKQPGVLIRSTTDFRKRGLQATAAASATNLADYVADRLRIPPVRRAHAHDIMHWIASSLRWAAQAVGVLKKDDGDPLDAFLNERMPPDRPWWRVHGIVMRLMSAGGRPDPADAVQKETAHPHLALANDPVAAGRPTTSEAFWDRVYRAPDALAGAYASRYRSSYIYVFSFAALALIASALALTLETMAVDAPVAIMAGAEFGFLLAIMVLTGVAFVRRWHERWISYRLLAELSRKQQALSELGWSLPSHEANWAAASGEEGRSWVNWYFDAAVRAAPLVTGLLAGRRLLAAKVHIHQSLVAGQKSYHRNRARVSERASGRFLLFGNLLFCATMAFLVIKVLLPHEAPSPWESALFVGLGLAASIVPALSSALFAVRSYAELDVLADQSKRMQSLLTALDERLREDDAPDWPLASQDLAIDLFHLTTAMLADVSGWAQLFRMKAVETGG